MSARRLMQRSDRRSGFGRWLDRASLAAAALLIALAALNLWRGWDALP